MATAKAKAKAAFSYQGKQYQPGEDVEAPDHEIMQLVAQGHVEDPRGTAPQPAEGAQHAGQKHNQPHGAHGGHPTDKPREDNGDDD